MEIRLLEDGIAVRLWGAASDRPLVFWHALGAIASGAWIGEVATVLAERGRRVVAIDGPGFGESPALEPDAYAVPNLADLLWSVVDRLELERPTLVGHSWGGTVAVHAAADRPEDVGALVLLDSGHLDYADVPGANPTATLAERIEAIRGQALDVPSFEALADLLAAEVRRPVTAGLLDAARAGVHLDAGGSPVPIASLETRAAVMQGAVAERPSACWHVLAEAGVPVLLLLATEPPETGVQNAAAADRFRAAIPHADIRTCEGWGHDLLADGGPALADIVDAWLDRSSREATG